MLLSFYKHTEWQKHRKQAFSRVRRYQVVLTNIISQTVLTVVYEG